MNRMISILIPSLFALQSAASVYAQDSGLQSPRTNLGLLEAIRRAEGTSPRIKGARFLEQASSEKIRTARSGYLPSLDVAAIAADGAPGAFSLLGVDGNISATQRTGEGGAAILKQTFWDFGRTQSAVGVAESEQNLSGTEREYIRSQIDNEVIHTFLECAFLKSEAEDAGFTATQARVIANETTKYVRSGQRSIIEKYLVDAQAKEADTLVAEVSERSKILAERLAIQLGDPHAVLSCPSLDGQNADVVRLEASATESPVLAVGQAQAEVAQHRLAQAKAEAWPLLIGIASGGYFQNPQLADKWNYSAGVGITLPLFTGFKVESTVGRYAAEAQAQEAGYEYSRQAVDETNSRYNEQIRAAEVRLDFLKKESQLADEAFSLAKKRYFALQGTMVDLREALRNLDRVKLATDAARRDSLIARGSRAVFNGARSGP